MPREPRLPWRPDEDELVRDVRLTLWKVSQLTGRSLHAVENRASRLGAERNERDANGVSLQRPAYPSGQYWPRQKPAPVARPRLKKPPVTKVPVKVSRMPELKLAPVPRLELEPEPAIVMEDPWTPEDLACVRDVSLTYKQVEERTGWPWRMVEGKAKSLGVRRQEAFEEWGDDELELVHDLSLSYAEVAGRIGRSRMAVKLKAQRLGLNRPVFWTRPGYEPGADSYRGEDWPKFRQLALERDGYACQDENCGIFQPSGTVLVVHHRIPWRLRPVNDLPWLITLCRPCHMRRKEHFWVDIPGDVQALLELDRLAGGDLSGRGVASCA